MIVYQLEEIQTKAYHKRKLNKAILEDILSTVIAISLNNNPTGQKASQSLSTISHYLFDN